MYEFSEKNIDHAHIGRIVSDNFHCCNIGHSIECRDGSIGSNQHYIVTTPISKYFLKYVMQTHCFKGMLCLGVQYQRLLISLKIKA